MAGCSLSWTPVETSSWTRQNWLPSTWTNTRSASALSSTPAIPTKMAASQLPSGVSASGGKVSTSHGSLALAPVLRGSAHLQGSGYWPFGHSLEPFHPTSLLYLSGLLSSIRTQGCQHLALSLGRLPAGLDCVVPEAFMFFLPLNKSMKN